MGVARTAFGRCGRALYLLLVSIRAVQSGEFDWDDAKAEADLR
jgi:hypothetical protein